MTYTIRSFVLRQGRISNAQRNACERLKPKYGIPFSMEQVNLESVFGRKAPKILEIGSGMGETTATIAQTCPEFDYLAIEVHTPGIGSLLNQIEARQLANLRVIQHDAVEVIRDMLLPESLDGVHIFFPDPWPKARHHKRRLIQPAFILQLCLRLKPNAYIHIATDWEEYAQHILAVLSAEPLLGNTCPDYAERPEYRPLTKFEQRGIKLGHVVRDLIFRRNDNPPAQQILKTNAD
jgi:tRNA (guanine-N7-)-methyltransferase